jgi:hypothetical protein
LSERKRERGGVLNQRDENYRGKGKTERERERERERELTVGYTSGRPTKPATALDGSFVHSPKPKIHSNSVI